MRAYERGGGWGEVAQSNTERVRRVSQRRTRHRSEQGDGLRLVNPPYGLASSSRTPDEATRSKAALLVETHRHNPADS